MVAQILFWANEDMSIPSTLLLAFIKLSLCYVCMHIDVNACISIHMHTQDSKQPVIGIH
jgi:hypothetical protein